MKTEYEKRMTNDPVIKGMRENLTPIFPELDRVKLMRGSTSYTMNKEKVYICTTDPNTGKVYDPNMLNYVLIHELAHSLCPDVGHTPTFMKIFGELLLRAEAAGAYDPTLPRVNNYCKLK